MLFELDKSNPLFQLALSAKRKPHYIAAPFISILFVIVGQIIGELLLFWLPYDLFQSEVWNEGFALFIENTFYFLPIILLVFFWVKFYEKRSFNSIGLTFSKIPKLINSGFGFGFLMFSTSIAIFYAFDFMNFDANPTYLSGISMLLPTLLILVSYLIQGSAEEVVFRGWLLPILGVKLNPWIAVFISSLVFALIHGANENITFFALLNLMLFGVFISLYALRQGSIWGVCAWHAIWNWLQGNFYGLEVSGNKESISLLNLKETGPDWLTGGKFGPEGGLVVSIVLLLGIVILLYITNFKSDKLKNLNS